MRTGTSLTYVEVVTNEVVIGYYYNGSTLGIYEKTKVVFETAINVPLSNMQTYLYDRSNKRVIFLTKIGEIYIYTIDTKDNRRVYYSEIDMLTSIVRRIDSKEMLIFGYKK